MRSVICDYKKCTGCAACKDVCPKQCITMQPNELDVLYPVIDRSRCIDCGLCEKTCPNNREIIYRQPQKVWVAWSNNEEIRRTSASGGVASELYRHWIRNGGVATGVVYDSSLMSCHFVLIENLSDIQSAQNSKYAFSDTAGIYKDVKKKLQAGVPVLFVGMPCQVAGLYGFLNKCYDNLTTVDIICHGMPPISYLQQHVRRIEQQKKEYTSQLYFRDPKYHTYTFTFTLKNVVGKEFYKKTVLSCDNYQLGYHKSLIYRENCYRCNYARKERISDLTIGDFSGLGRSTPFRYDKRNVSCVLQNTTKGGRVLRELHGEITLYERPCCEAFEVEQQLKSPSVKHVGRSCFEQIYVSSRNFEKASNAALKKEKMEAVKKACVQRLRRMVRLVLDFFNLRK